jgi:hypothetical protein
MRTVTIRVQNPKENASYAIVSVSGALNSLHLICITTCPIPISPCPVRIPPSFTALFHFCLSLYYCSLIIHGVHTFYKDQRDGPAQYKTGNSTNFEANFAQEEECLIS